MKPIHSMPVRGYPSIVAGFLPLEGYVWKTEAHCVVRLESKRKSLTAE
jgi:hypothetical protein